MKKQIFILADDILKRMIENDDSEKAVKMLEMIEKMKEEGVPYTAVASLVGLLRAIWQTDSNGKFSNLQRIIEIIQIIPTPETDYKDKKAVIDDTVKFANKISEEGVE